jgi:hypothetical protein
MTSHGVNVNIAPMVNPDLPSVQIPVRLFVLMLSTYTTCKIFVHTARVSVIR